MTAYLSFFSSIRHCDDERLVSNGFEITGRSGITKYFVFLYARISRSLSFCFLDKCMHVLLIVDRENDEIRISLVKMNSTIPYFGVSDLVEVLGKFVLEMLACS